MAQLIATGDWHLTEYRPRSRKDDYISAMIAKIKFIADMKADRILNPGDVTDSHEFPDKFKTKWISRLSKRIICVPGQHDLRYHTSGIVNTPLGVLSEAVGFKIIHNTDGPFTMQKHVRTALGSKEVSVYGAGWNKKIPEIIDMEAYNILLTHRMVIESKLWDKQESYDVAGSLLRRNKFDLIVSGDNHQSFHYERDGKMLINCGSLMRSKIDQVDHKPCVWVIDTDKKSYEQIFIPIAPAEEVFNVEEVEIIKARNNRLDTLKDSFKNRKKLTGLDYKKRVIKRTAELKPKALTKKIINGIMSEA